MPSAGLKFWVSLPLNYVYAIFSTGYLMLAALRKIAGYIVSFDKI